MTEKELRVPLTISPPWNELGVVTSHRRGGLTNAIRVVCKDGVEFTLRDENVVMTTDGFKKVSELNPGINLPCITQPSTFFNSDDQTTDNTYIRLSEPIPGCSESNDGKYQLDFDNANAFKLMQIFGVLSHAFVSNGKIQFHVKFPDTYSMSDDVVILTCVKGYYRFNKICEDLGMECSSKIVTLGMQNALAFNAPKLYIINIHPRLMKSWKEFSVPSPAGIPSAVMDMPTNLQYAWLTGRLESTLVVGESEELHFFANPTGGAAICTFFPGTWNTDDAKKLMTRLGCNTEVTNDTSYLPSVDRLEISSNHGRREDGTMLISGYLWIAACMPFMFNSDAVLWWSELILKMVYGRTTLEVVSTEPLHDTPCQRVMCQDHITYPCTRPGKPKIAVFVVE